MDVNDLISYVRSATPQRESKRAAAFSRYNDRDCNRYCGRYCNEPRSSRSGGYDYRDSYRRGPAVPPPTDRGRYYDEPRSSRHGSRGGGYDYRDSYRLVNVNKNIPFVYHH